MAKKNFYMVYHCIYCKNEGRKKLYEKKYIEDESVQREAIDIFIENGCSCCGRPLFEGKGYMNYGIGLDGEVGRFIQDMHNQRIEVEEVYNQESNNIVKKIEKKYEDINIKSDSIEIKDFPDLIKYIEFCVSAESCVFTFQKELSLLLTDKSYVHRVVDCDRKEAKSIYKNIIKFYDEGIDKIETKISEINIQINMYDEKAAAKECGIKINKVPTAPKEPRLLKIPSVDSIKEPTLSEDIVQMYEKIKIKYENTEKINKPEKPVEPIYKKPGLFNRRKVNEENDQLKRNYSNEIERFNAINKQYFIYEELENEYNKANSKFLNEKRQYEEKLKKYHVKIQELEEDIRKRKEENDKKIANYNAELEDYKIQLEKYESEKTKNDKTISDNIQKFSIEKLEEINVLNTKKSKIQKLKNELVSSKKQFEDGLVTNSDSYILEKSMNDQIKNIKADLSEAINIKSKLYSMNIIYPKYRNYIAMSTIYEYLKSGRCKALEGKDGAYNIYEQEKRIDAIIVKLDTIVDSLEQIKENQYTLYCELKNANRLLKSINKKLDNEIHILCGLHNQLGEIIDDTEVIISEIQMNNKLQSEANELTREQIDELYTIESALFDIGYDLSKIEHSSRTTAASSLVSAVSNYHTARNTESIAYNTRLTAHYSAISAYNSERLVGLTNSLGFMLALR